MWTLIRWIISYVILSYVYFYCVFKTTFVDVDWNIYFILLCNFYITLVIGCSLLLYQQSTFVDVDWFILLCLWILSEFMVSLVV